MQLKQRLSSDQGGSNFVQALGEELQQASKGDSWGVSDDHDKGIKWANLNFVLFRTFLFPLPKWVIWDIYGPYMGMIWDYLCDIYGFHMVFIRDITHHIKPVWCHKLPHSLLSYLWERYVFRKILTIPIYGSDIGYGNGMGWLPLPDFKPWRTRYESVNYGISNHWST